MSNTLYGVNTKKDYLDQKVEILGQLLAYIDTDVVKDYIKKRVANAPTEQKREVQIDNICRTIMNDYYNGDRSFCTVLH